jgi:hypothetical protein
LQAALVPGLEEKLKQSEANLDTTTSKLQPMRGRPSSSQTSPKTLAEMSEAEAEAYLASRAEAADLAGVQ